MLRVDRQHQRRDGCLPDGVADCLVDAAEENLQLGLTAVAGRSLPVHAVEGTARRTGLTPPWRLRSLECSKLRIASARLVGDKAVADWVSPKRSPEYNCVRFWLMANTKNRSSPWSTANRSRIANCASTRSCAPASSESASTFGHASSVRDEVLQRETLVFATLLCRIERQH